MLLNSTPKRCSQCENILKANELEQKWCDKCREHERDKSNTKKKNRVIRKQAMNLFGIRKENDND